MRRGRGCCWGLCEIGAGVVILMALVLPAAFWWFLLGAGLIGFGIWTLRCR